MAEESFTSACMSQSDSLETPTKKRKVDEPDMPKKMPREINLVEFAKCRAREIEALTDEVMNVGTGQRVHQKLPKHLRRRAMSHNVKRLPRRMRQAAKYQIQAVNRSKRPSRYYRRRPKNMLAEYNRRQQNVTWLETHIWHAKRFKMIEKWGYKIPLRPNDKSARASYRATTQHCLLQDLSYYTCVELQGTCGNLISGLGRMTSPSIGYTFGDSMYIDGSHQGSVVLYEMDKYPHGAIGPVDFLWRPPVQNDGDSQDRRILWVWLHPAICDKIMQQFIQVFQLQVQMEDNKLENGETDKLGDLQREESVKKPPPSMYSSNEVSLKVLKFDLLRYRLVGPLSQAVLTQALDVASVTENDVASITEPDVAFGSETSVNNVKDMKQQDESKSYWWENMYDNSTSHGIHRKQREIWNYLKTDQCPDELTTGHVVGLTVRDPRLFLTKHKAVPDEKSATQSETSMKKVPAGVCWSPLWSNEIRLNAKQTKLTDEQLNTKRSKNLVPGSELKLGREESRIPIILIGHSSASCQSKESPCPSSCWDIILPSSWGMAFWLALVYKGARVGGLTEMENHLHEQGRPCFPNDFPDTEIGNVYDSEIEEELTSKHWRYPPAKRPNFCKLGVRNPFEMPWTKLVQGWVDAKHQNLDFKLYVLRARSILKSIARVIDEINKPSKVDLADSDYDNSLVRVSLQMHKRGVPERYAMICMPSKEDIDCLNRDPTYAGPLEPAHKDVKNIGVTKGSSLSETEFDLDACSRRVLGYVCKGGFSFTQGHAIASGFCAFAGIVELLKSQKGLVEKVIVLVRNNNTLQYRFANLEVQTWI